MENELDLFTRVGDTTMDSVSEVLRPIDTETVTDVRPAEPVLNWWSITWKGYDGIIRTIECEIYQEWQPVVIGVHPWGNKSDHRGIPISQIIEKKKIPKPDPHELLRIKQNGWKR